MTGQMDGKVAVVTGGPMAIGAAKAGGASPGRSPWTSASMGW